MTEKRFTLAYEKGNWWAVRDGDITLWKEEVISLLNDFHEENEQLKKDLKKKFVPFAKADGDYTTVNTEEFIKILNENEQLKQEIRVIEKAKDSFYDKVEGLLTEHIEYNQLKPENMDSVIKELNELKMEIFE